jgi:NhaA family Na+:H+ antiporter
MSARIGIGLLGNMLSLTLRDWFSEGLLAVYSLLVGLEIRREMLRAPRVAEDDVVATPDGQARDLAADVACSDQSEGCHGAGWMR